MMILEHDDEAPDSVGSINLIGKTFFKQVKIFVNGQLISESGDKYAYR